MTLSSRCPENRYLSPNWCQLMAAFQESTVYISLEPKPESTEGGRRVSVLKRQEGAPVNLG